MRFLRSRIFLALAAVVVLVLGLLAVRHTLVLRSLSALDQPLTKYHAEYSPPRWLPATAGEWVEKMVGDLTGSSETARRFRKHFCLFLGGGLAKLSLYMSGDAAHLADTLRRFPHLELVWLDMDDSALTEAEASRICEALRRLPRLSSLALDGREFTDTTIAPLAGHPRLAKLALRYGSITRRSISTFTALPSLEVLALPADRSLVPQGEIDAIKSALPPHVTHQPS